MTSAASGTTTMMASGGSTSPPDVSSGGDTTSLPGTGSSTTTMPPDESSGSSGAPLMGDVLQNDSWTPSDALTWQTWPSQSDCWASVFEADGAQYPFEIVGAVAAIGNGDGVFTFEIGVWEVSNQGQPTTELASRTVELDGATTDLSEIDLSGLGLGPVDSGEFALVMCHTEHMGAPSIATDADGNVDDQRNWVFQQAMGDWVAAPDFFGIDGDFILRAVIMPQA